ncbi:putative expressed protein [Lyophyllum shimeji]|uniref:Expressed protein n=1 Tax=Lyophyllum shimeji TaxID=47721 RepID=A0A9P3PNJ8_LYOSH|nr:putative expressed protein [Lyophyllum shimeji]
MSNVASPLVNIAITSVVCTIPAIATTVYRLCIRRGRYWADDAWALCSAVSQLIMFISSFVHIANSSPKRAMVAVYYLMAATFYTIVWFARLSILFSIIRIDPCARRRRLLLIISVFFLLTTVVLVTQLFWVCEPEPRWKEQNSPYCYLTRQVVVLQVVTDIVSDSILIVAPLRLVRSLHDRKLPRRLTIIFSTCLITTIVSLVHAAFIFTRAGHNEVIAAIVEDCVSLIVCNIPVVSASLLRIHREPIRANATPGSVRSGLRFASWHTKATSPDDAAAAAGGTTIGTIGWRSTFRWDRELPESETELDQSNTTSTLPTHESHEVDHDIGGYPENDILTISGWRLVFTA